MYLKTNIKCVHYSSRATEKEQLASEMKINGIYDEYKQFEQSGKYDTLYDKNRNQAMAENKLTKIEVACIFLLTLSVVSNQVKSAHRRGETCLYRCLSQQVVNALAKLKYFDKQSNFDQLEYIYSGISLVTFDLTSNECDRYFNILQKEDCITEENLKDLTQGDLKEIGIVKMGHRKSLVRAFSSLCMG